MAAKVLSMPEIGKKAPSFSGKTQTGESIKLADLKGKKVALYFYPRDHTSGCTKQACSLRDGYSKLRKAGITVVGVSPDTLQSHQSFSDELDLPFALVPDTQKKVIERYGVWGEKNLYGKKSMGLKRTTFLIDEEGVLQHIIKRPNTKDHANEILAKFAEVDRRNGG